jgi:hypothetical protein
MNREEAIDWTERIVNGLFAMTKTLVMSVEGGEKLVPENYREQFLGNELPDEYKEYIKYIKENLK